MAKQGDLWDDSALVTAFNEAITNYKKMNVKKASDVSNETISGDQSVCDLNVEYVEATRQEDENEKADLQPNTAKVAEEISNPKVTKENQCVEESVNPHVSDSHTEVAFGDGQKSQTYSQGSQDYNQLLSQYYELEQQRQQIVNQLNQYGNWNYQYYNGAYGSGTQWTNGSTFQEHSLPVGQASNATNSFPSFCPCVGQCCAAPCTSVPTCFLPGPCADPCGSKGHRKSTINQEDSNIVETAMGAAERAISSLRTKIADDSNLSGAKEGSENDGKDGAGIQSGSSETDLSVLLNAWYSAGFYTGKYLVEQSIAKKQQS